MVSGMLQNLTIHKFTLTVKARWFLRVLPNQSRSAPQFNWRPQKNTDIQLTFDKLVKWFESRHNMRKGNRNQGAFTFATGVAEYLTLADAEPMLTNYIMSHVEQPDGDPFPRSECESCIRQAYRNNPVPRKLMNNVRRTTNPIFQPGLR